jgi:hypothetical protein
MGAEKFQAMARLAIATRWVWRPKYSSTYGGPMPKEKEWKEI